MNMGEAFERTAERTPDAVGLVDPESDVRYTYREWFEESVELAAALQKHSIGTGDRVAAAMRNRAELATLYTATQLIGAVFVPYNFRVSPEELSYLLESAAPDVLVVADEVTETVKSMTHEFDADLITVDSDVPGAMTYRSLRDTGRNSKFEPTYVDATKPSLILHTGGTTGDPKGVPRSHENTHAAATAHAIQNSWSLGESTLGLMSLSHTMGIHTLATTILLGGKWICQCRFSAGETADLIETEEITSLYLVPTVFHDLLQSDIASESDLSSVAHVTYAGSNMGPATVREIQAQFDPETFVNHYGSTEVYTHAICDLVSKKPNCVGYAGINTTVRVVEPSDYGGPNPTATVGRESLGEIIVDATSPEAFDGYLTENRDDDVLVDGWFFTGDLGYRDEDGDLFFVGRVDDMIISGGENIYPIEVETVLEGHEAVAEAAVVGRPSERWNQAVTAFVTLANDPEVVNYEEIVNALDEHCRNSADLANFKRPRKYFFIDSFTKSNVGKILRKELQQRELDVDVHHVVDV
ncbi:class I adenylate-forming enzyme family protein [Halobaculum magnesiiphilum]|uniref:AMP-binding protein n=1 Tax=Halobaculum magnesiiphilum TaxID=1017351 RepID=A0A8T8WHE7_9EURY|nr:AMP-binding protein [Halobaculum magnesiiphilum]QZP39164.1 AMP-binding protein [Halobaculum magnesiiphilum]